MTFSTRYGKFYWEILESLAESLMAGELTLPSKLNCGDEDWQWDTFNDEWVNKKTGERICQLEFQKRKNEPRK